MTIPNLYDDLMSEALSEAQKAMGVGEVPVGAVLAHKGKIIYRAHNLVETFKDATAHAEMITLKAAGSIVGDWRLTESVLCVTLEPCTMCSGAIRLARVGTVIFGASDPRMGAMGSLYDLSQDSRLGPVPRVIRGIKEQECQTLLRTFFTTIRKQ